MNNEYTKLETPNGEKKILLHCCCAPCSAEIMTSMVKSNLDVTVFFYNPNIHPREEYERRKKENIKFADKLGIPFIDAEYDVESWFDNIRGLEHEPERGARCTKCFDKRLEKTASFASENGFKIFATSLSISRWKDIEQVNKCGENAAEKHSDVSFWNHNWRKKGGSERMSKIAKEEQFYRQNYCGCVYSISAQTKKDFLKRASQ